MRSGDMLFTAYVAKHAVSSYLPMDLLHEAHAKAWSKLTKRESRVASIWANHDLIPPHIMHARYL